MTRTFRRSALPVLLLFPLLFLILSTARAQGPGQAPPASVAVAEIQEGTIAPETEFVGTVYYPEVSEISGEVSGAVAEVLVEEGERVRKGAVLVRLDAEALGKTLAATRASHGQVLADLERARRDLGRIESLYKAESIAEQVYDENRFKVKSLEQRAASLAAEVGRLEVDLRKTTIRAPFGGVIIRKTVNRGEWVAPGRPLLTLALDDSVDVIVEVPGEVVQFARRGTAVVVKAAGKEMRGQVTAVIPSGDVATRTFPVKIRVANRDGLIEGMAARVTVPTGEAQKALIVSRDALVTAMGKTVVYAIVDVDDGIGKAKLVPVTVLGYKGMEAGIAGDGLRKGMPVVTKGNERLRDGQAVQIVGSGKGGPQAAASSGSGGK
jgi:membrane fusion protein, multidrug efflux system